MEINGHIVQKSLSLLVESTDFIGNRLILLGFLRYNNNGIVRMDHSQKGGEGMELRQRIISAANTLFGTEGLRFTMQQLADALHISKKTIYAVYPSKEALLLNMVDTLFSEIRRVKQEQMNAEGPIEQRIEAVVVVLPEQYRAIDFRMLNTLDEKYPAVSRRVREHLENNWEPTIALLKQGMAEGRIRPVPISVLRRMVAASIECFLAEKDEEDLPSYPDLLKAMIDIIMNGIRARDCALPPAAGIGEGAEWNLP